MRHPAAQVTHGSTRLGWTDLDHTTGQDGEKSFGAGWHERWQILYAIRFCAEDQDGDSTARHVLLVFDIPIAGEHDVAATFRKAQEFAVLFGTESRSPHGLAFVAHGGERNFEFIGKAFVDEDFHFPKRARRRDLASSRAAMACSRPTPGYCFRNSSSVSPPSK